MKSKFTQGVVVGALAVTLMASLFWLTTNIQASPVSSGENLETMDTNTLLSRFISLSVSGAKPYGNADFDNLASPHRYRYISLPASGYSALLTDFTLPPDYASGTEVTVRFMVNSASSGCFVLLGASSVYENPTVSASANIQFPDAAPPISTPRWTADADELKPFSIAVQAQTGNPFLPGDSISIAIERYGDDINDTCPTEILISGMSVTYEGLTSFLPLVARNTTNQ